MALVIGNNAYKELHALDNPGIDAQSLAQMLAGARLRRDFLRRQAAGLLRPHARRAFRGNRQLKAKSQDAALAFVFYAGHGMEAAEGNVLVPVDADVDCERQQVARGVLVDEVLEALAGAKQKIVVLDACRNNPLGEICPPATKAKLTFRDFKVPDAGNFLLVSSTKPGQVADDGLAGAHSPFARALLAALSGTPNVHFDQVFNRVSKTVIEETSKGNFTQIPEMLIRGGAPEDCLAGKACAADPQAAALREELAALQRDRARDQELGETAKEYLAQLEKQRGKPLSEDERRRELASLKEATRSLAARNDNRGERALEKLKTGDTGEAKRLFQEDLDAETAEEQAEAQRRAERRKKAAASARNIAALARWTDVAEAVAYYKRAVDLDPDDAQTWDDYARAAQDAGHTDEAKAAFEQAAVKASGEGADEIRFWAAEWAAATSRSPRAACPRRCNTTEARKSAITRLSVRSPANEAWQRDLSVSYNKVGGVLVAQGNLPEALENLPGQPRHQRPPRQGRSGKCRMAARSFGVLREGRRRARGARKPARGPQILPGKPRHPDRLAKADPKNAGWQRDLSVSYNKVGGVLVAQGNLPEALKSYQGSLAIRDRLAKADPGNAGWQRDLSVSYAKLAAFYAKAGEREKARAALGQGKAIMEAMTKLSPDNATWKRDLAWFEGEIAALPLQEANAAVQAAFGAGDFAKAAALQAKLAATVETAEREKAGKPGQETASALGGLSWYRLFARDFKGALTASDRAIAIEPGRIVIATNKAHALMFLGRAREARALYLRYKGQRVEQGGKPWEAAILDDFKEFGQRGLKHRQMAEIEALLAAK